MSDRPEDIPDDVWKMTEGFFESVPRNALRHGMMVSFAYGVSHERDRVRREGMMERFMASVETLRARTAIDPLP